MKLTRSAVGLLMPGLLLLALLFLLPLAETTLTSFRSFVPGRIGAASDAPLTLQNYRQLLDPAYLYYLGQTFWVSLIATAVALSLGLLIANMIVRMPRGFRRSGILSLLVVILFLGVVVRVYAVALAFGPVGFLAPMARFLGLNPNGELMIGFVTIAGLLHWAIPMAALVLIATIQNIDPALNDAALVLGAAQWKSFITITLPLAKEGLLQAFLLVYALCVGAFIIPMVLGQGRLLFLSNLVFNRFSLLSDYPGGAALAVLLLITSLILMFLVTKLATTGSPKHED